MKWVGNNPIIFFVNNLVTKQVYYPSTARETAQVTGSKADPSVTLGDIQNTQHVLKNYPEKSKIERTTQIKIVKCNMKKCYLQQPKGLKRSRKMEKEDKEKENKYLTVKSQKSVKIHGTASPTETKITKL